MVTEYRESLNHSEDTPGERPAQEGGSTMSTKHVKIYSDGACSGNPGPGGYAAILQWNGHEQEVVGHERQTTNNRMELTAVIEGLKALKEFCSVIVYTDSQYVIGVMTGWKRKANYDLLATLDVLCAEHWVTFQHVRGHAGHPLNERADKLAVMQREKARSVNASVTGTQCIGCGDLSHESQLCPQCRTGQPPPHPRRPIPSGFEQIPDAIADSAPIGAR